jgi:hypothetical protein
MYVGESNIYGRKLVAKCQGSKARRLPKPYTDLVSVKVSMGNENSLTPKSNDQTEEHDLVRSSALS